MPTSTSVPTSPFDPISGDLLPAYREAYLQGKLPPDLAQTVEAYLKGSPIQTNIVLGRAQELVAHAEGQPVVLPAWVQQQLRFQPTVSAVGPLRRPVVRLALGLFLALLVASGVQWLRNEPLVPAPIAKAVARAATAATQATQQLVQHFAPAAAPKAPATIAAKPARPRALLTRRPAVPAATPTMPTKMAVLAVPAADSLATAPVALPATTDATGTVHGRITDTQGRPLPGATVLVRGTGLATSANAAGDYVLAVPSGATLQFGYGGYADQSQRSPGSGIVNVTLQPAPNGVLRRRQR